MESALTPREIQARIRAGESLAEVAQAAGVPEDHVEGYAGPVLAEREHVAQLAEAAPVRRRGETGSQRQLGETVTDALAVLGVDPELVSWDAWRNEDRQWTVRVSWPDADDTRTAHFEFNQRGRFSLASDQPARDLIAEHPPVVRQRSGDPDAEPTLDLHDELAIVRVVQDDTEPPTVVPDVPVARIMKLPGETPSPDELNEPDDYADAELAQVDGVYDIISNPRGDMDVLYDMLSGFNEDSVRIYSGLTQPVTAAGEEDDRPVESEPPAPRPAPKPAPMPGPSVRQRPSREPASRPAPQKQADEPKQTEQPPPGQSGQADEPTQEQLVEAPEPPRPQKPGRRRKRASVPTWDEIMFGGPSDSQ